LLFATAIILVSSNGIYQFITAPGWNTFLATVIGLYILYCIWSNLGKSVLDLFKQYLNMFKPQKTTFKTK